MNLLPLLLLSCQDHLLVPNGTMPHSVLNELPESNESGQSNSGKDSSYDEFTPIHVYELDVLNSINDHRSGVSLPSLEMHPLLVDVAREHSMDMAYGDVSFGHAGFEDRIDTFLERVSHTTYRAAENVGQASGDEAVNITVDMWLNSEGHRDNIEGPYHFTGIGAFEQNGAVYFTQIFLAVE